MEKREDLFLAFMDLEKAYDRVTRRVIWRALLLYGAQERLGKAIKSFKEKSEKKNELLVKVGSEIKV